MTRYEQVISDIFSIFSRVEWLAEGLTILPPGFSGGNTPNEFSRFNIVLSATQGSGASGMSSNGIMIVDIFCPNGHGPKRIYQIADILDLHLVGRTYSLNGPESVTQFLKESNLSGINIDTVNSSLLRAKYQISFNYFRKEM